VQALRAPELVHLAMPLTACDAMRRAACLLPQMAVDKLKQGIDSFAADQRKLEETLAALASGMVKMNH
jgi:hypothetical protein